MEFTRYYTMFYVEPVSAYENGIVRDVLTNECVAFTEAADGCIHVLFNHQGSERMDDRILRVAKALDDRNIVMHGHVTRLTIGECYYSVSYGFVEDGEFLYVDLNDISSHMNRITDFLSIRAFADRNARKHLCVACPDCGAYAEVYADFNVEDATAPLIVLDDGDIYIDYDDMDIDFTGVFRCGSCDCVFTGRTDKLKNLIPTQDKQEAANGTEHEQPMFIDEALDAFMDSMKVAYTPGTVQYVYKQPDKEINLTV